MAMVTEGVGGSPIHDPIDIIGKDADVVLLAGLDDGAKGRVYPVVLDRIIYQLAGSLQ